MTVVYEVQIFSFMAAIILYSSQVSDNRFHGGAELKAAPREPVQRRADLFPAGGEFEVAELGISRR